MKRSIEVQLPVDTRHWLFKADACATAESGENGPDRSSSDGCPEPDGNLPSRLKDFQVHAAVTSEDVPQTVRS